MQLYFETFSKCISANKVLERLFRGQFSLNVRTGTRGELTNQLPSQHYSWSQPQLFPTALSHEGKYRFVIWCAYVMYLITLFNLLKYKNKTFDMRKLSLEFVCIMKLSVVYLTVPPLHDALACIEFCTVILLTRTLKIHYFCS